MKNLKELAGTFILGLLVGTVLVAALLAGSARQLNAVKAQDVNRAQEKAGQGYRCWAEDNDNMPEGYEILCDRP